MKTVSIFGSTGSIGQTTLRVLAQQTDPVHVKVLTGGSNAALLAQQAIEFGAEQVVICDESALDELQTCLLGHDIKISVGRGALLQAAQIPVDWVMSAVVGFAGLEISLNAAEHCQTLALANKESLVCAGRLLKQTCRDHDTHLLPVDSEHSAIFQCMNGEAANTVERVVVTASGGPFRDFSLEQMKNVTPKQAATHPNWSMGQRISIDSASMFNKAMEIIEAKELFDLENDQIEVMIHPQSIIHSMVGFVDGNMIAQLGPPNMAGAIGYAYHWPERATLDQHRLSVQDLASLTFEEVDNVRFPAINLARRVISLGGLAGAVFNGAKEFALDMYLAEKIGFLDMGTLVEVALNHYVATNWDDKLTLENVIHVDSETRKFLATSVEKGTL